MSERPAKSVITCDTEGRIETFNEGAQALFGYAASEVVGRKRVSYFSPGLIVLGHVGTWLSTALKQGHYEGRTVFVRKDGSRFPADIRITPTVKNGAHVGYCGVTRARPDLTVEEAMPPIPLITRLFAALVIVRAPFLTATLVPMLAAAAFVSWKSAAPVAGAAFTLALLGGLALHVAANVFNDYFDWKSGADEANTNYFMPFSGGSRSIELGLVRAPTLLWIGWTAVAIAASCGAALVIASTPWVLAFGAAGLFAAYFYTAPPLRLVARKGLGELFVGLMFGPMLVAGTVTAIGAPAPIALDASIWVGVPIGLLTTAILWINQFPDFESDLATGKLNLVVVIGKRAARHGYVMIVGSAFAVVVAGAALGRLPGGALAVLLAAPLAVGATRVLYQHFEDRRLVKANAATIQLQLAGGLLLAAGVAFAG